jgi:hypothetical protein
LSSGLANSGSSHRCASAESARCDSANVMRPASWSSPTVRRGDYRRRTRTVLREQRQLA